MGKLPQQRQTTTGKSNLQPLEPLYFQTINEARAAHGLPPVSATSNDEDTGGIGVGIGLIICGLVLLAFPRLIAMETVFSTVCYVLGLLALLIGVLGTCSLAASRKKGKSQWKLPR